MEAAAIVALFSTIRLAISTVAEQLELAKANGDISEAEYQRILSESVASEIRWDEAVAEARNRIAARNGG